MDTASRAAPGRAPSDACRRGRARHARRVAGADRPWFLWDVDVTDAELRARLHHDDPAIRAQWQARVLREARADEALRYVRLDDLLRDWERIRPHLGRRRSFWEWLLDGWRNDGLLPAR